MLNKQQWTALQDVEWVGGSYRREMLEIWDWYL